MENWRSELELGWQGQIDDLVTALVCAPTGHSWVASSAAGTVIWNPGLVESVQLLGGNGQSIDSLAYSADSRWLAAAGQSGELLIWDCAAPNLTPQLVRRIQLQKWIENLAWHPVYSYLAISYGRQVEIWDMDESKKNSTWKLDCQSAIFDLAWHPTGQHLTMCGSKGVKIWAYADSSTPIEQIPVDTASLTIAWSGDGRYLAAGNLDRTLTIVDWQNPEDRWTLSGCPGKIRQIAWIESGSSLIVASGNAILAWQLTSDGTDWVGQLLEGHQDLVVGISAHPITAMFGSASSDGYICLWSVEGEIRQIITDDLSKFTALAWHPQAKYLVAGSQTGSILLWNDPSKNTDEA